MGLGRIVSSWVALLCISIGAQSRVLPSDSGLALANYDQLLKTSYPELQDYNSSVLFYLYTQSSVEAPERLWANDLTSLKSSRFDNKKPTRLVIHGFTNDIHSEIIQLTKNDLLKFEDVNVIGVDWGAIAKNFFYSWVASETPKVGRYVGDFINYLIEQGGVSPDQVHLIGHSLGAQAVGFAGKQLNSNGNSIARVTGLDPPLFGFSDTDTNGRISSTDAQFVDCIHTTANLLGYSAAICQADFFPNGGIIEQPGCSKTDIGVCSHGRSYLYFAESIDATHHFPAETCESIVNGTPEGCSNGKAEMGYFANPEVLGEFYLKTHSSSPFAQLVTSTSV